MKSTLKTIKALVKKKEEEEETVTFGQSMGKSETIKGTIEADPINLLQRIKPVEIDASKLTDKQKKQLIRTKY